MASVDPEGPWAQAVLPPPPSSRRKGSGVAIGVVMVVVGVLGVPACLVAAVLTANPCGSFGDQCADYGQTSSVAVAFMYGMVLSAGLVIAGVVVMTVSLLSRRRDRRVR
jgi:hypothetical protein